MLNSVIIEGNVIRNMELVETPAQTVGRFAVCYEYTHENEEGIKETERSCFDVECYGKLAERLVNYATQGRGVRVVGRLKQEIWKDQNNKEHAKVYVLAEHIEVKPKN